MKAFVFDRFIVHLNGSWEESIPPTWLDTNRPTMGLLPPGPLLAGGLRELLHGHATLPYLIAAITARVIAPLWRKKLPPLALLGDNRLRAAHLAHLVGCSMPPRHLKALDAPGWPYVLTSTTLRSKESDESLTIDMAPPNVLVAVSDIELKVLSLEQPWQRLRCPPRSLPSIPTKGSEADQVLRRLVPAFLAHLLKNCQQRLAHVRGEFIAGVYTELTSWLYSHPGAENIPVPRPRTLVDPPNPGTRAETSFAWILRALIKAKEIRALPRIDGKKLPDAEVLLMSDGTCDIHWKAVAAIVAGHCNIPVDWSQLGRMLADIEVLSPRRRRSTCPLEYRRIWKMTANWWQDHVAGPLEAIGARAIQKPHQSLPDPIPDGCRRAIPRYSRGKWQFLVEIRDDLRSCLVKFVQFSGETPCFSAASSASDTRKAMLDAAKSTKNTCRLEQKSSVFGFVAPKCTGFLN